MYGDEPSDPGRYAANLFADSGARDVLELGAGQGRDTIGCSKPASRDVVEQRRSGEVRDKLWAFAQSMDGRIRYDPRPEVDGRQEEQRVLEHVNARVLERQVIGVRHVPEKEAGHEHDPGRPRSSPAGGRSPHGLPANALDERLRHLPSPRR